jgi:hypothetical protein
MSRHEIPAKNPDHKVIVGWDHPLLTYFAQVIDRAKEVTAPDDKIVFWVGTGWREIYEVEDLARRIRNFAELSFLMRARLYADKDDGL